MAYVFFDLVSKERRKFVPDRPRVVARVKFGAAKPWEGAGRERVRLKTVRDEPWRHCYDFKKHHHYQLEFTVPGFAPVIDEFQVTHDGMDRRILLPCRTRTPATCHELSDCQRRILGSMADTDEERIWQDLSDNQCATFFQVTYVLDRYKIGDRRPLAHWVKRLLRVGGSKITCPDSKEPVKGWRLHVELANDGGTVEELLTDYGFTKDPGRAHKVHAACGYTTSFRAKIATDLNMQVCVASDGAEADIDLDTPWHRSAPWRIYGALCAAYRDVKDLYVVDG